MKQLKFSLILLSVALAGCSVFSIRIEEPRTSPAKAGDNTAVYFVLQNSTLSDDRLLGADTAIAQSVEIHQSALIEEEDKEVIKDQGGEYNYFSDQTAEEEEQGLAAREVQMEMPKLDTVWIAAGREIEFEPAYLHLMLIGLKQDLAIGDQFTITLHFERYGDLQFDASVESQE